MYVFLKRISRISEFFFFSLLSYTGHLFLISLCFVIITNSFTAYELTRPCLLWISIFNLFINIFFINSLRKTRIKVVKKNLLLINTTLMKEVEGLKVLVMMKKKLHLNKSKYHVETSRWISIDSGNSVDFYIILHYMDR